MTEMKAYTPQGDRRRPIMDFSSHSQAVIRNPHREIHEGHMYLLEDSNVDVNATPLHISFTTPDSNELLHLISKYDVAGVINFTMTEAPTGGLAGGTAATPINRRRGSSNVSGVTTPLIGASAPTGGTELINRNSGGAQGNSSTVGQTRGEEEWNLLPNTTYSFRITSTTAGAHGYLNLGWYETADFN